MLPNACEEQYDTHTCHIVQKHVKMCVYIYVYMYILNCKKTVSIKYTSGEVCTAKKSWQVGRSFRTLVPVRRVWGA